MGAHELKEFFENKEEATKFFEDSCNELDDKRAKLILFSATFDGLANEEFNTKIIQLHSYCEITEKTHPETENNPNRVMPGWANIRDGSALL